MPDHRVYLPQGAADLIVKEIHRGTHLGQTKLEQLLRKYCYSLRMKDIVQSVVSRCEICAKVNSLVRKFPRQVRYRVRPRGSYRKLIFLK